MPERHEYWYCELCEVIGKIPGTAPDVISRVQGVGDAHKEASPECEHPLQRIRTGAKTVLEVLRYEVMRDSSELANRVAKEVPPDDAA
jgi:hypothetical protein